MKAFNYSAPWAVADGLYGLDDVLDADGRPLGERRSSTHAKTNVAFELKTCPYRDSRNGEPMNVSALKQVLNHAEAARRDIEAFARIIPNHYGAWSRMLLQTLHLLAGPSFHLLRGGAPPIPSRIAVGYKLAAGFFSVLNSRDAIGGEPHDICQALLRDVSEKRSLHGASEVCAGPLPQIADFAATLMRRGGADGNEDAEFQATCLLTLQVCLGAAWRRYDEHFERAWLAPGFFDQLTFKTQYFAEKLRRRRDLLRNVPPPGDVLGAVPGELRPLLPEALRNLLKTDAENVPEWLACIERSYGSSRCVVDATPSAQPELRRRIASYIAAKIAVVEQQRRHEEQLREHVAGPGKTLGVLFGPSGLIVPRGHGTELVEATIGGFVEFSAAPLDQPETISIRDASGVRPLS